MKLKTLIILLTIVVALAAANLLAARHPLRLDLTEHRVFTLSPATRALLSRLDDVVTIRVYFSKELPPEIEGLRRDVEDELEEFKGAAGEKIQVEHLDPGASPADEQKAQLLGIPAAQLNVYTSDKAQVAKVYLGLAVLYGAKQQVIPFVRDTSHLEYQLAEAIVTVSQQELPAIGWWESGAKEEDGPQFRVLRETLGRRYAVVEIEGEGRNELDPARLKAVVLASPARLTDAQLVALDQYLMEGGSVIALVDRAAVGSGLALAAAETNAADWLARYGITVEDALAADAQNAMAAFAGGVVTYHIPYPFWPEVRRDGFDRGNPAVADLESAVFPWTSPLTIAAWAQNAREAAMSTEHAVAVARKEARLDPTAASDALKGRDGHALILAAELHGPFASAFAAEGSRAPLGAALKVESLPSAHLFVVGSSRWADDRFLQLFPQNLLLFENVLDAFAMDDVLIGIRSRQMLSRPIVDLSDAARAALKYLNIAIGPFVLLLIGIGVFIAKRVRIHRIMARYQQ